MIKRLTIYFLGLTCFTLSVCGTVSPEPYARAKAQPANIPPGQSRVTPESLEGVWRNETGDIYAFRKDGQRNIFQSNVLNEGTPGIYEINPVLSSFLLVFYSDRNVEGSALFPGVEFYFDERRREQSHLNSIFAVLSEDRQTLTLGGKIFSKVGI
jgi:hypothetical protein